MLLTPRVNLQLPLREKGGGRGSRHYRGYGMRHQAWEGTVQDIELVQVMKLCPTEL